MLKYFRLFLPIVIFSTWISGTNLGEPPVLRSLEFRTTLGEIINGDYPQTLIKKVLCSLCFAAYVYNHEQAARDLNAHYEQMTREALTTPVLCLAKEIAKSHCKLRRGALDKDYEEIKKTPFVARLLALIPVFYHDIIKDAIMKPLMGLDEFRPHESRFAGPSDPSSLQLRGKYWQIVESLSFKDALKFLKMVNIDRQIAERSPLIRRLRDRYAKDKALLMEHMKNQPSEEIRQELIRNFEESWSDHIMQADSLLIQEQDIAEMSKAIKKGSNTRELFAVLLGIPMGTNKVMSPMKITDTAILNGYSYFLFK